MKLLVFVLYFVLHLFFVEISGYIETHNQNPHFIQGNVHNSLRKSGFTNWTNIDYCSNFKSNNNFIIIVISAVGNFDRRQVIRTTWGSSFLSKVPVLFAVGYVNSKLFMNQLKKEHLFYNDLIQGHYLDSYQHLTMKVISVLEYVTIYCFNFKYVLKCDDDVFVNTPTLEIFAKEINDSLVGKLKVGGKPSRIIYDKYYISYKEYPSDIFPSYLQGSAYLISVHAAKEIYLNVNYYSYVWLEDVFITGIVASKVGIPRKNSELFNAYRKKYLHLPITNFIVLCPTDNTINLFSLWKSYEKRLSDFQRKKSMNLTEKAKISFDSKRN